jgi:hypothetical protein
MIEDVEGKPQPEVGVGDHWEMFRQVRLEDRLFPPLADAITRAVEDAVRQSVSATIDSRRLGAEILTNIGSTWHALFSRCFPGFPNGADSRVFGMTLWNHLALRQNEVWRFVEQADPHGFGLNSMRYWKHR